MGSVKILSANDIKRIAGVSGKQYKKIAWHTGEITVKQLLTAQEYADTVHRILDSCQTPDGSVAPELLDFAVRVNVISAYGFVQLPDDIETLYYAVYASDLYDTICNAVNKAQVEAIKKSVMMYIEG